jgi:hypothetical protein
MGIDTDERLFHRSEEGLYNMNKRVAVYGDDRVVYVSVRPSCLNVYLSRPNVHPIRLTFVR